jgi:hypothetical protein
MQGRIGGAAKSRHPSNTGSSAGGFGCDARARHHGEAPLLRLGRQTLWRRPVRTQTDPLRTVCQHDTAELKCAGSVRFPVAVEYLEAQLAHFLPRLTPESTSFIDLLADRLDGVPPDDYTFAAQE